MTNQTLTLITVMTVCMTFFAFPAMWAVIAHATHTYATKMPEAMLSHRSNVRSAIIMSLLTVAPIMGLIAVISHYEAPAPWLIAGAVTLVPIVLVSASYSLKISHRFHAAAATAAPSA